MSELAPETTSQRSWLAFTKSTSEDAARTAFRARYGLEPLVVGLSLGNVLAGPVPAGVLR